MRSAIRIVKRDQNDQPKKQQPEVKQVPQQSTREVIITVKSWVAEFRERKRNQKH